MPPVALILKAVAQVEEWRAEGLSPAEIMGRVLEAAPYLVGEGEALSLTIRWFMELERTRPTPKEGKTDG